MKPAGIALSHPSLGAAAHGFLTSLSDHASAAVAQLYVRLTGFVTHLKIARTEAGLRALSDAQLSRINVSRKGIRAHAERLVMYRYDGL